MRQRYDFTADQGKVDWTRIITPHLVNGSFDRGLLQHRGGPPEDALALASIQKAYDRTAALGDCAPSVILSARDRHRSNPAAS